MTDACRRDFVNGSKGTANVVGNNKFKERLTVRATLRSLRRTPKARPKIISSLLQIWICGSLTEGDIRVIQAHWINSVYRVTRNIVVEVHISSLKSNRVFACEAADLGVVHSGAVVVEFGEGVVFAAGEVASGVSERIEFGGRCERSRDVRGPRRRAEVISVEIGGRRAARRPDAQLVVDPRPVLPRR